jgi:hypothetical protein
MRFFLIQSTGELEAAVITLLSGVKGRVYDFSNDQCRQRNRHIVNIFKMNDMYTWKGEQSSKLFIFQRILSFKLVLSINYNPKYQWMRLVLRFLLVSYIRDSLIPPVNNKYNRKVYRLFCESQYSQLFPYAQLIEIQKESVNRLNPRYLTLIKVVNTPVKCILKGLKNWVLQYLWMGKGRTTDNICIERFWRSAKVERVYLNAYQSIGELTTDVNDYIKFYNHKRFHQMLDYKKPMDVHQERIRRRLFKMFYIINFKKLSEVLG